jgi:hypothetical protein
MAKPNEKLAESLKVLKAFQDQEIVGIRSGEISRTHRERLQENGYLKEVLKGWYIVASPEEPDGDTTSWYISYWKFCARYLNEKYGEDYTLSAEQSIILHSDNKTVPDQLIVRATNAPNKTIALLHGGSIYEMRSGLPKSGEIITKDGIRMLSLTSALVNMSPVMYQQKVIEVRTALSLIKDASEILPPLLTDGRPIIAGNLAGAFRNNNQPEVADEIVKTMESAGYNIKEVDPFDSKSNIILRGNSPYVNRIELMWEDMRQTVIENFPAEPGIASNQDAYLEAVDKIYLTDAYHSLSIEQYVVSKELIEKVRKGDWDVENNEDDKKQRNALAARGYWLASRAVKKSIQAVLNGANSGEVFSEDHRDWYRELFAPSVRAGIIDAANLAGYRSSPVYIKNARHVPPNVNAVRDAMPVLCELLTKEHNASVRAILGNFIFVYIHPYRDGNGRMGRFLMNLMLASGGYPWTVIPVELRNNYMDALDKASAEGNIEPFAKFIGDLVLSSMKGEPVAKI